MKKQEKDTRTLKKTTIEDFIEKAKKVHGNEYDYSLVIYQGCKEKIMIKCSKGHIFEQRPNDHLMGHGCKICAGWGVLKENKEEFIRRAREIHEFRYDYTESEYESHGKSIHIRCPHHGLFSTTPASHLIKGIGCPACKYERKYGRIKNNAFTHDFFIFLSKQIHGDFYDYSKAEYFNMTEKVIIICPIHGEFKQSPKCHIHQKQGCPKCKSSKGEKYIETYLKENKIKYYYQYVFEKCKDIRVLPFDFYLPEYNICIEFDGIQHYKPIKFYGGEESLKNLQKKDKIKDDFCKEEGIKLLRIKYNENIKEIVNKIKNEYKNI